MDCDLVIFDLHGTLINHREPIWKTQHQHFGSDPARRKDLVMRGLSNDISYSQWFAGDLELLRGAGATRAGIMHVGVMTRNGKNRAVRISS